MERYILKKPKTKSEPDKYFAGHITKRKSDKIIVTSDVTFAGLAKNAYIFTNKHKALDMIKELKSPSTWKVETI